MDRRQAGTLGWPRSLLTGCRCRSRRRMLHRLRLSPKRVLPGGTRQSEQAFPAHHLGGMPMATSDTGLDPQHSAAKPDNLIGSDKVQGTEVRRTDGTKIGTIERLMIDKPSGQV